MSDTWGNRLRAFFKSNWAFPAILSFILLIVTILQIHGSSIGVLHRNFYGSNENDPSLIIGQPRAIRTDEWRGGWTPFTFSQAENGFKGFNEKLGSGRDMIFAPDSPSTDWATIFRPQNWAFFILPFDYAFSFRWWLGLYLIVLAFYFFILRIFGKDKVVFAILMSLSFALSPFLFWWHQPALHLAIAHSLLIMMLGMRLIDREPLLKRGDILLSQGVYVAAIAYLVTALAMLIYAPFIIACFLVAIAFLIGYLLQKYLYKRKLLKKEFKRLLLCGTIIAILSGALVGAIALQHWDVIETVGNSEYPGQRFVEPGKPRFPFIVQLFGGLLQPLLQSDKLAANYFSNQSESSNFILLLPFFLIPGIFLQIRHWQKKHRINYVFLCLQTLSTIYILFLTVPFGDLFYKLIFLDRVPHNRLIAGIGFIGFLQLLYFIKLREKYEKEDKNQLLKGRPLLIYLIVILVVLTGFGFYVMKEYPGFVPNPLVGIALGIFFVSIIASFLAGKKTLGASLLLAFSLLSTSMINPLYKGMGLVEDSAVFNKIREVSNPEDTWIVLDSMQFESIPMIAGRSLIGGQQLYADHELWSQLDTDGDDFSVYNRQAHAVFLSNTLEYGGKQHNVQTVEDDMELVKQNVFKVRFTCSEFMYSNVDYVLSVSMVEFECLEYIDKIVYPNTTFVIYRVTKQS